MALRNAILAVTMAVLVLASPSAHSWRDEKRTSNHHHHHHSSDHSSGNPFEGKQVFATPKYASQIKSTISTLPHDLAKKAEEVAKIGTWAWVGEQEAVGEILEDYICQINDLNTKGASPEVIGAFVLYNLPNRDCSANASTSGLTVSNGGIAKYKHFIDSIAQVVEKYSKTTIALVLEPDAIANILTNLDAPRCAEAEDAYIKGFVYAMHRLNLPNVHIYLDAANSGWLGWGEDPEKAAALYTRLYNSSGKPAAVRGLATNIANYNAFNPTVHPNFTEGSDNWNEKLYIDALTTAFNGSFPAHFIVDTGRNGQYPGGKDKWGDWCNVKGMGFGVRPTTETGDDLVDAFQWIKPGGQSDGTSNTTSPRFDKTCALPAALQPAPEAGTWFTAYFEQLLKYANPPI